MDTRHEAAYILIAFLVGWGALLFFENTYFAAFSFGFSPPVFVQWVGMVPWWVLNIIDTVAVAAIVAVFFLLRRKKGARRE